MPRRKPYTARGICRCPCFRCGAPAWAQWSICADDNYPRPICKACDIKLNALTLRFMGDPDRHAKMTRYRHQLSTASTHSAT